MSWFGEDDYHKAWKAGMDGVLSGHIPINAPAEQQLENRPTDERGSIPYKVLDVYQAAMALFDAYDAGADMELLAYSEGAGDLVEKWAAACRRAKEGRGVHRGVPPSEGGGMRDQDLAALAGNYKSAWVEVQELRVIREELEAEIVGLTKAMESAVALLWRTPAKPEPKADRALTVLVKALSRAKEGR